MVFSPLRAALGLHRLDPGLQHGEKLVGARDAGRCRGPRSLEQEPVIFAAVAAGLAFDEPAGLLQRFAQRQGDRTLPLRQHRVEPARQVGAVVPVADRLVQRIELRDVAIDRAMHGVDQLCKGLRVHLTYRHVRSLPHPP
ncbi:MAG: hypothetical protein WAS21_20160 [Geminicoccaceae bacterium]